jgi:hypothetical protein
MLSFESHKWQEIQCAPKMSQAGALIDALLRRPQVAGDSMCSSDELA